MELQSIKSLPFLNFFEPLQHGAMCGSEETCDVVMRLVAQVIAIGYLLEVLIHIFIGRWVAWRTWIAEADGKRKDLVASLLITKLNRTER
jgi:hypothetical protein